MGEQSGTLEVAAFDIKNGRRRAIFRGMNWAPVDVLALVCPSCSTRHHWKARYPRRCRHCGMPFLYTANEAVSAT